MVTRTFNLVTSNGRGLTKTIKLEKLSKDILKYKIDICCIQETKINKGCDVDVLGSRLVCIPSESAHYGNR